MITDCQLERIEAAQASLEIVRHALQDIESELSSDHSNSQPVGQVAIGRLREVRQSIEEAETGLRSMFDAIQPGQPIAAATVGQYSATWYRDAGSSDAGSHDTSS